MRPPPGGVRGGRDRDVDRVDWWDPPGEVGGEVGGEWRGGLPLPPPERRRTPATAPPLPYCPTLPPGGEEEEEEREAVEGGAGFLRVRRTGVRPRGGGRGWPTWPTPTPTLRPEHSWGDDLDRGGREPVATARIPASSAERHESSESSLIGFGDWVGGGNRGGGGLRMLDWAGGGGNVGCGMSFFAAREREREREEKTVDAVPIFIIIIIIDLFLVSFPGGRGLPTPFSNAPESRTLEGGALHGIPGGAIDQEGL